MITQSEKSLVNKRLSASDKSFLELLRQAEKTIPIFYLKNQKEFPIRVFLNRHLPSHLMGENQGRKITLFKRAFESAGTFLYTLFHEVGHVIFSYLDKEAKGEFLRVLGVSESRWKRLVMNGVNKEDLAIQKASLLEVRRIHEEFAEAYAEYWTKKNYLKARSKDHRVSRLRDAC